jgi:hypothetical protein
VTRPPLVLHSSLWRLSLQSITPLVLLWLGLQGLTAGARPVPVLLTLLGLVAGGVVLFDLPVRSEFTADGITRVCVLRRQHLPWSTVVAVERTSGMPRRPTKDGTARPPSTGRGLVARTGARRLHLLVDRRESRAEFEQVRMLLRDRGTQLRASEPPLEAAPAGRGPRALHRRTRE